MRSWGLTRARARRGDNFDNFRGGNSMKPMNAWSMIILLIIVVALVIWLKPQ